MPQSGKSPETPALPILKREYLFEARGKFVKELFPIAMTVGFAERVSQMSWLLKGSMPSAEQAGGLLRLSVAALWIVFAWDWYHRDIIISPVRTTPRYVLDVIIGLSYLRFMLMEEYADAWV